jgi:hypothetical protein
MLMAFRRKRSPGPSPPHPRSNQAPASLEDTVSNFLITCFDENDTELRDIKINPTTSWPQIQECITDAFGTRHLLFLLGLVP